MVLLVLPLTLVAAVYLAIRGGLRTAKRHPLHGRLQWLIWWALGTAVLISPALWYQSRHYGYVPIDWPLPWFAIGIVTCAVTIFVALSVRQSLLERSFVTDFGFNKPKAILTMTLLWTLSALPGALYYGSAAPFDEVMISINGVECAGFLVGQSTDRIYVGEKEASRRILSVGLDDIHASWVGDSGDVQACSESLIQSAVDASPQSAAAMVGRSA
jgi:hypothetical protein